MPSEEEAYVWVWLPGATEPVVAGRLHATSEVVMFNYGRSYLESADAIPLYLPELPLQRGLIRPRGGLTIAGCIKDAGPDAWGQRIVMHKRLGDASRDVDPDRLTTLTYLLESGSDRVGALDFQASSETYVARVSGASLEEMVTAADRLEAGEPLSPDLDAALFGGSSLGGARPKVQLEADGRKFIAKLSSRTDTYSVVKAEAVAMNLARRVGLDVADSSVIECLGHNVLLVERFDRTATTGERRMLVSALTLFELDEMMARYATYHGLAQIIRERFVAADRTLRELFSRIVFNICVSNTDDHARNHAAFWDGRDLTLSPAYDICPQPRTGGQATQAMEIAPGFKFSQLRGCVEAAEIYHLSRDDAFAIINHQLDVIDTQWADAADEVGLTEAQRQQFWQRQILNRYASEGYSDTH